jgi:hypothetical protein
MDFYGNPTNIDLREELEAVLRGRVDVVGQGRNFILRKLTDDRCVCFDATSGGARRDCSYCQGEGYLWRETMEFMYLAQGVAPVYKPGFLANGQYPQNDYGYTDPYRATGYCGHYVFPDYERYTFERNSSPDKLYDLKVDDEGNLFYPITKVAKWKILNLTPLHGDFGRIEFFELSLERETIG